MCAETCFYMSYRNLSVEGCKSSCSGCGGIAMDEHDIGLTLFENVTHAAQDADCDIGEVLSLLHDIEVDVGLDIEYLEHLVEHFTMLTCDALDGLELICPLLEFLHQRTHLDGLRTGAED